MKSDLSGLLLHVDLQLKSPKKGTVLNVFVHCAKCFNGDFIALLNCIYYMHTLYIAFIQIHLYKINTQAEKTIIPQF